MSLRSQNRRIWGTFAGLLRGSVGLLGGVDKLKHRMDSSRSDSTPAGAVRKHILSRSRLTANRGPSFLTQRGPFQVAVGSGSGGWSPHPAAVGPDGLEPSGTATGLGWSEDSWGSPVSSDGVCGWLADGYHYPKDTWGSTEARNRLRA